MVYLPPNSGPKSIVFVCISFVHLCIRDYFVYMQLHPKLGYLLIVGMRLYSYPTSDFEYKNDFFVVVYTGVLFVNNFLLSCGGSDGCGGIGGGRGERG